MVSNYVQNCPKERRENSSNLGTRLAITYGKDAVTNFKISFGSSTFRNNLKINHMDSIPHEKITRAAFQK